LLLKASIETKNADIARLETFTGPLVNVFDTLKENEVLRKQNMELQMNLTTLQKEYSTLSDEFECQKSKALVHNKTCNQTAMVFEKVKAQLGKANEEINEMRKQRSRWAKAFYEKEKDLSERDIHDILDTSSSAYAAMVGLHGLTSRRVINARTSSVEAKLHALFEKEKKEERSMMEMREHSKQNMLRKGEDSKQSIGHHTDLTMRSRRSSRKKL